ncbi:MAG: DUF4252 domain-containing protein [Blastocatellia bacterium]|nr:DUF4252 domain-containing protein [Blastocatellia bacterium]
MLVTTAKAQDGRLQLDSLNHLDTKAEEMVNISLDQNMLKTAANFLDIKDPAKKAELEELVKDLKGVYIKVLEFNKPGEYSLSEFDVIKSQLREPIWSKLFDSTNNNGKEFAQVYTMNQGGNITGLAIIAAEEDEFVVINIIGSISLEKLKKLQGNFGIPDFDGLKKKSKENKKVQKNF